MSRTGSATAIGNSIANSGYMYIETLVQQSQPPVPPPPPARDLPSWVVERAEADQVIAVVCSQDGGAVGITTALEGAGGFGKTTLADIVCANPRVRQHFSERVYAFTMGRDVRGKAAIARKIGEATRFITGDATPFDDPQLAGAHLGRLLDQHPQPPILLVIDDVWEEEQLAPFLIGGSRCVRLVTTRRPESLPSGAKRIRVDEMSAAQARAVLTWELPPLPEGVTQGLLRATGRWPLLLRLTNRMIAAQLATGADPATTAKHALEQMGKRGPVSVDKPSIPLNLDDPEQRKKLVRATVEAATTLLPPDGAQRFAELGIFAEDEAVPVLLVAKLWRATAGLDEHQSRDLCDELGKLSLLTVDASAGGRLILHDVIRDYTRNELGLDRLIELNATLMDAVGAGLPEAAPLAPSAPNPRTAWWDLTDGYMLDHTIAHLLAAGRTAQAEALACDLRWVEARLHHRGPNAASTDCAKIHTPTAEARARDLTRIAHLLGPTDPADALTATLHSRLESLPGWHDQVTARQEQYSQPVLLNRWAPPDLPDTALLRTQTGHTGWVEAVAVAPDGTWLATAGRDATVRICDVATGAERAVLRGHGARFPDWPPEGVTAVAVAPDGTWLASAGKDQTVRIWDVATWTERAVLTGHTGEVSAVAVAPDGAWLATASYDATVRVWDVVTGTERAVFRGDLGSLSTVAVAPNGVWLATASRLKDSVRILDVATGAERAVLRGHTYGVTAVAVAPDGTWLATAGQDLTVRVWDVATGTERAILRGHSRGEPGGPVAVNGVAVDPNSTWLASVGTDQTVRIWDVATGAERAVLRGHVSKVTAVAVSPDGTWLATTSEDLTTRIWDVATENTRAAVGSRADRVNAVVVAPDGSWLASGGGDATVRVWDVATGAERAVLRGHRYRVIAVAVAPDGTWLASASSDQTVRIWDVATATEQALLRSGTVEAMAVSPDGTWLATGHGDRTVRIWDVATWTERAVFTGDFGSVLAVAVSPTGTWLATAYSGERTAWVWDVATGTKRAMLRSHHTDEVTAVAVAPDGTWLATGSRDLTVRVWDVATGAERAILTGHADSVSAVAVAPDGSWLATTSGDLTVRVWDVAAGQPHAVMRIGHRPTACAWTPDGRSVVVGSAGGLYAFDFHPRTNRPPGRGVLAQTPGNE
ncbi:NB-ARC domain-containing protein [Streptomyces anulatus]|uniref:NB-ARC domain-containing protein n=1 Tax=Streptomyces anulatus TaxID=1892 RepID=UPI002251C2D3|nr:NB-ARC domain-containing protein [Streptomyces anulatus]MCX4501621.1 NB-ARC domain-containing protein [Streptomyces anulatus]